jgi:hypothetical protein
MMTNRMIGLVGRLHPSRSRALRDINSSGGGCQADGLLGGKLFCYFCRSKFELSNTMSFGVYDL